MSEDPTTVSENTTTTSASTTRKKTVKSKTLYVWMTLINSPRQALLLVDTGACVSILPKKLYEAIDDDRRQQLSETRSQLQAGTGTSVTGVGEAEVEFMLNNKSSSSTVLQ